MNQEQRILRVSVTVTVMLAAAGVAVGLAAGSTAIVFDGVYALADTAMTGLALGIARLIADWTVSDRSRVRSHSLQPNMETATSKSS